jgi:ankyrin repeat protein
MNVTMEFSLACGRGDLFYVLNALREDPSIVHHARLAGWTPIFYAVRNNEISVVNELLKCGADPHAKDSTGTSAYAIAIHKGYKVIQCLIENNDVSPS